MQKAAASALEKYAKLLPGMPVIPAASTDIFRAVPHAASPFSGNVRVAPVAAAPRVPGTPPPIPPPRVDPNLRHFTPNERAGLTESYEGLDALARLPPTQGAQQAKVLRVSGEYAGHRGALVNQQGLVPRADGSLPPNPLRSKRASISFWLQKYASATGTVAAELGAVSHLPRARNPIRAVPPPGAPIAPPPAHIGAGARPLEQTLTQPAAVPPPPASLGTARPVGEILAGTRAAPAVKVFPKPVAHPAGPPSVAPPPEHILKAIEGTRPVGDVLAGRGLRVVENGRARTEFLGSTASFHSELLKQMTPAQQAAMAETLGSQGPAQAMPSFTPTQGGEPITPAPGRPRRPSPIAPTVPSPAAQSSVPAPITPVSGVRVRTPTAVYGQELSKESSAATIAAIKFLEQNLGLGRKHREVVKKAGLFDKLEQNTNAREGYRSESPLAFGTAPDKPMKKKPGQGESVVMLIDRLFPKGEAQNATASGFR